MKIYTPNYTRFQPKRLYFHFVQRWSSFDEEFITKKMKLKAFLSSVFFSMIDKSSQEHFDVIITGDDPLLAVIEARILQKNGKRVLIYKSEAEGVDDRISALIKEKSGLESSDIIEFVESRLSMTPGICRTIKELISSISNDINNDNLGDSPSVMILEGSSISLTDHWSSKFESKFVAKQLSERPIFSGFWKIPYNNITRMRLNPLKSYQSLLGSDDTCIIQYNKVILNTRPSQSFCITDNIDAIFLGDARSQIEKYKYFDHSMRIKEISTAIAMIKNYK